MVVRDKREKLNILRSRSWILSNIGSLNRSTRALNGLRRARRTASGEVARLSSRMRKSAAACFLLRYYCYFTKRKILSRLCISCQHVHLPWALGRVDRDFGPQPVIWERGSYHRSFLSQPQNLGLFSYAANRIQSEAFE
jgi:hypothetical protein